MPEWPAKINEEIRQHLDEQYEALRASGVSHEAAVGSLAPELAALTSAPRWRASFGFGADLRYAIRALRKSLPFSALVVVTLALGIGANTAIFSVLNAVVLRPLPYDRAGRLVVVRGNLHKAGLEAIPTSAAEFVDYRDRNTVFDAIAAYDTLAVNVTGVAQPERATGAIVTASLFSILGAAPSLGRTLVIDDETGGRDDVVVINHEWWQRSFRGDPDVIGRTIAIDGKPATVVGVMPARFAFPDEQTEFWMPLSFTAEDLAENQRGSHAYTVLGRLRGGVSVSGAQDAMKTLGEQIGREHPGVYRTGFSASLRPLRDEIVGSVGPVLILLTGAVMLVLVIACANVANLCLARATARQREVAIRTALGASRTRVVQQLLVESALLAAAAGGLGVVLAAGGIRLLVAFAPPTLPRLDEVMIDRSVVAAAVAMSMITAMLFGIVPALRASTTATSDQLKDGSHGAGDAQQRGRLRRVFVAAEVSLSLVLLAGAGLLINSFARVQGVYPGFRADHLLTARLALSPSKYTTPAGAQKFFASLFDDLRRQPGVENAAAINAIPFGGHGGDRSFFIEGRPVAPGEATPDEQVRFATAGYFAVMQIPVRGREFTERDVDAALHVAVVNDAFAKKYWPGANAIGHRVQFQQDTMNRYEIVGIAGNVRHRALDAEEKPELYIPVFQPLFAGFRMPAMDLVVRTAGDPAAFVMTLRSVVSRIDPDQPVADARTMDERIGRSVASRRFTMLLLTLFSALAVVLAGIGMAGLVAYAVVQRTHEIGVRLALGAQPRQVVALMLGQGLQPALIGTALGLVAAAAAARAIRGLLFGIESTDLTTFAAVATLLLVISAIACWLPARRASSVDPILALRTE